MYPSPPKPHWRHIARDSFKDWSELATFLGLSEKDLLDSKHFPLKLPRRLAEKIEKGNLNDPILKQFVPAQEENVQQENFSKGPFSRNSLSVY